MVRQTLEKRVERLETRMNALEEIPARVASLESQFVQLRQEVRVEFSAVRSDIKQLGTQMRVLHEDVIDRIKRLSEGG